MMQTSKIAQDPDRKETMELESLSEFISAGLFRYAPNGEFDFISKNFCTMLGYSQQELRGFTQNQFLQMVCLEDRERVRQHVRGQLESGHPCQLEYRVQGKDGSLHWLLDAGHALHKENGNNWIYACVQDISAQKATLAQVSAKAMRDPLTGLYNKGAIDTLVNEYLQTSCAVSALMLIDVDNFKLINDTLGHVFGDAVLSELAHTLKTTFGRAAIAGRVGGDEFVLFMRDSISREHASRDAQRLIDAVHRSFNKHTISYEISGSIGVALFPTDGKTYQALFSKADIAMYNAKVHGKNQFAFYSEEMAQDVKPAYNDDAIDASRKNFRENMGEYIFRIFYENPDVENAIPIIYDLIGKTLQVSRIFTLEKADYHEDYTVTFEWCNEGVPPMSEMLGKYSPEKVVFANSLFDAQNPLICYDASQLQDPRLQAWYCERAAKAAMFWRICDDSGEMEGVIGYEFCETNPKLTDPRVRETLVLVSQIVSTFLIKTRKTQHLATQKAFSDELLQRVGSCIYGIDPSTYELLFCTGSRPGRFSGASLGKPCFQSIAKRNTPCPDCPIQEIGDKNDIIVREHYIPNQSMWMESTASYITLGDGRTVILMNSFDITRFRADAIRVDFLSKNIPGGMMGGYLEENMPLYFINNRMLEYLGYPDRESFLEATNGQLINSIHPQEKAAVYKQMQEQLFRTGEYAVTYRMRKQDGSFIWIQDRGKRIQAENGKPATVCVCLDITEQMDLQNQVQLYREAQCGGVFMVRTDDTLSLLYANDIFYDIFECTRETMFAENGGRLASYLHPADLARLRPLIARTLKDDEDFLEFDSRIRTHRGNERYVQVKGRLAQVNGYVQLNAFLSDTTERHFLQDKIRKSEERYRIALEHAHIEVWEYNIATRCIEEGGRYDLAQFENGMNQNVPENLIAAGMIHENSVEALRILYRKLSEGIDRVTADIRVKNPNGMGYRWKRITYITIFDEQRQPLRAVAIAEDVTRQKESFIRYQEELQARQSALTGVLACSTVNLTKDTLDFLRSNGREIDCTDMRYAQMFNIGIANIANAEDKARYSATLSREGLINAYAQGKYNVEVQYRRKDAYGRLIWVSAQALLLEDALSGDLYAYGTIRDINEQKNIELGLLHRAERDAVTGAYRRDTAISMMDDALEKAASQALDCALILVNVDNFDELISKSGYMAADEVMRGLYNILERQFGQNRIIGRLYSDQFAVFLNEPQKKSLHCDVWELRRVVGLPYMFPGIKTATRITIGIAFTETSLYSFHVLYEKARVALGLARADKMGAGVGYAPAAGEQENALALTAPETSSLLLSCAFALISAEHLSKGIDAVLKKVSAYYHASNIGVMEEETGNSGTDICFSWSAQGPTAADYPAGRALCQPFYQMLSEKHTLLIEDISCLQDELPEVYENFVTRKVDSLLGAALSTGDKTVVGCMVLENPRRNKEDTNLLRSVGSFLAAEIARRRMQKRQEFLNTYDALTGLQNRASFVRYSENLYEDALISLGVACFDINGLKELNSKYGYLYGDDLIRFIGHTFQQSVSETGHAFRFAGDEFLVICENMTREAFMHLVTSAREKINAEYPGSLCMGCVWADTEMNLIAQMRHADELLILAKKEYYESLKNMTKRYNPSLRTRLFSYLEKGCFEMFLQPKVQIQTGITSGAEALVRLRLEGRGLIYPDKFIPLLEEQGNIRYIDLFMFEQVCQTLQKWQDNDMRLITISLNFSRNTLLTENLLDTLASICQKYTFPLSLLEIEITESVGEIEREVVAQIGKRLIDFGLRLSLDDFGARYSNISILSALQLHTVKLDKSLVNDLFSNERTRIIVKNFLDSCNQLDIESVAEGVETAEQLSLLGEMGCDIAQGYYFNKAIPLPDFEREYIAVTDEAASHNV